MTVSGDPYRPFRPRRGVWMAVIMAIVIMAVVLTLAITLPGTGQVGWSTLDRVLLICFGGVGVWFVLRYARLRAIPTTSGLRVVNLLRSRNLEWAEIMGLGFADGAPWPVLELTDTDEVAVMAIQRADGEHGRAEASRLAALIRRHSELDPPQP